MAWAFGPEQATQGRPAPSGTSITATPTITTDGGSWPRFTGRAYYFSYPPTLQARVLPAPVRPRPGQTASSGVIKASFFRPDTKQQLVVLERATSEIKQSLLQPTTMDELGSPADTARLLLPRNTLLSRAWSQTYEQPAPATPGLPLIGALLKREPLVIHRHEARLTDGTRLSSASGIMSGLVISLIASGSDGNGESWDTSLDEAVDSFRLLPRR